MIDSFEDLRVWQAGHQITLTIYRLTKSFPLEERYGLISQLRRASISIQNNIAEGYGRRTTKDYVNFLYKSLGSAQEVRCMLRICLDLDYISNSDYQVMKQEILSIIKMLKKLIYSLMNKALIS